MKKIPEITQQRVKKLRQDGLSHRQIAIALNISLGSVYIYSKGITLTQKQHLKLMRENYKKALGKISIEERIIFSRKGGINTPSKFKSTITKQQITYLIKEFYSTKGRIPFRKEFAHAKAARNNFGSWNKAIEAAGLSPNPVKFAKKYIAEDGHKCDSLAEMIIDDWLTLKGISHERRVRYLNTKFTADFKVNDTYIEFFGLHGQHKIYDKHMHKKFNLIKKNNLKLIPIYPADLFPELKLNGILEDLKKV